MAVAGLLAAATPADGALTLALGPAPALSNLGPGKTATGSGTVTVTASAGTTGWTLQAQDQGSGAGSMVAASTGCSGSDSKLANPLELGASSTTGGVTSPGAVSLSASPQTIATATGLPLASTVPITTDYTQVVPSSETMLTGCAYTITVTFTAQ